MMHMKFVPITVNQKEMEPYLSHPFCREVFQVFTTYYPKVGFELPWVGYFFLKEDKVVGIGGFKGAPKNHTVEIAYAVIPEQEGKGVGTDICKYLIAIARKNEPAINITARTLMVENASTSILRKNGFELGGIVNDPEDGEVWEWKFIN